MARSNGSPRRATLIASALVVGVIVVAGAILTGRALISDDEDPSSTEPPASADSSSKCDLPDGDLEKLTEPPADVEWELINTYALPSGPAGPAEVAGGGVHHCYARSAEGAVLAAASFAIDLATPGVDYSQLVDLRVTGPGAADLEALNGLSEADLEQVTAPNVSQIVAFRVDSISKDQALIQIVHRYSTGQLAGTYGAFPIDLRWIDGDWKYYASEGSTAPVPVASLTSFVEWSGA